MDTSDSALPPLRASAISPKITCLILAYNEESRIRTALTHALRWADEVIVVDKGSTDRTLDIAIEMGAQCHGIPFSSQGHERYEDMVAPATHDWVWHFTPGEVPTRKVIEEARRLVNLSESPSPDFPAPKAATSGAREAAAGEIRTNTGPAAAGNGARLSLIRIPTKLWSFGVHDPRSPWGLGYQPRLYHKGRVRFTGVCHAPIEASPNRIAQVPAGHDCFVYHPTHATAESFIRSHADYAINEARRAAPEQVFAQAIHQSNAHDHAFNQNPDLLCQQIAWKIWCLNTALHAAERMKGRDVGLLYRELTEQALSAWLPPSSPSASHPG